MTFLTDSESGSGSESRRSESGGTVPNSELRGDASASRVRLQATSGAWEGGWPNVDDRLDVGAVRAALMQLRAGRGTEPNNEESSNGRQENFDRSRPLDTPGPVLPDESSVHSSPAPSLKETDVDGVSRTSSESQQFAEELHGDGYRSDTQATTSGEPEADPNQSPLADDPELAVSGMDSSEMDSNDDVSNQESEDDPDATSDLEVNDRVVNVLLRRSIVVENQVRDAQRRKRERNLNDALWRVLAQRVSENRSAIYETAAHVYAFAEADLARHTPDPEFTRSMMDQFTEDQRERLLDLGVVPHRVRDERGTVELITHDPMRPEVHRVARQLDVDRFDLKYAPEAEVDSIISEAFPRKNEYLERMQEDEAVDLGQKYQEEDDELVDDEQLEAAINRSTLINLFEATLVEAVREGASDIHIYPNSEKEVEIDFRIDGRLEHWHTERRVHPEAMLSVIKDNTMNVDRFERDAAQDGFIQRWVDDTRIRFRVSVMPIANASQEIDSESIVIRVLDDRKVITDLNKLGLGKVALDRFEHAINQPHGMVILTGPTGSGKSTTLVAALHRVIGPEENVLTVEDPVEYIIEGARQIKLSDKLQLEDALRSILRHDPDTVMVGEMRDKETAELAIKLANTGHLTFSTLHTNDAPSAISRLYKMGIEPFLIAYAINLVVAQRLIRTLCPDCKTIDPNPDPVLLDQLGFPEKEIRTIDFYTEGQDPTCSTCSGTGYKGRQAVAEALHFSRPIRHMIVEADDMVDESAIREHAEQEDGMLSLQASARQVVKQGDTSIREMMRVVASESK